MAHLGAQNLWHLAWLDPPGSEHARGAAAAGVRVEGAKMLDEYIVREQARATDQWNASCASDDALKRQIRAQLSEGRLGSVDGVSKSQRGTGRACTVCRRTIEPTEVEREVEGQGVVLHAHEACYKPWREESVARRAAAGPVLGWGGARRASLARRPSTRV